MKKYDAMIINMDRNLWNVPIFYSLTETLDRYLTEATLDSGM